MKRRKANAVKPKRCKDCGHEHDYVDNGYRGCPFRKICVKFNRTMYVRKWWKLGRPK